MRREEGCGGTVGRGVKTAVGRRLESLVWMFTAVSSFEGKESTRMEMSENFVKARDWTGFEWDLRS